MKDDGFKPSSHSPIIDHEVQNDIDELMNSAPVAENDNWISANHFYNFDDDNEDDDLDIDALMSSTLPLEEMTIGLHRYIKISTMIVTISIVIAILIL